MGKYQILVVRVQLVALPLDVAELARHVPMVQRVVEHRAADLMNRSRRMPIF